MKMKTQTESAIVVENLDASFSAEIASMPGGANIRKCFACGTCSAGCPVTNIDEEYSSRAIIRKILYGMREEVLKSPAIWLCTMCYRCYARCPQEVNFTDIMRALRHLAVRDGYASADMLAKEDEADKKAQTVRRDLISNGGANGKRPMAKRAIQTRKPAAPKRTVAKNKKLVARSR
jgi:heterodisulfide reductase subunit C2